MKDAVRKLQELGKEKGGASESARRGDKRLLRPERVPDSNVPVL